VNLPTFALKHRAVFIAATVLAMIWGVMSFYTMPRREDPEFTIRACQVLTDWPGATAEDVELLVTDPLEQAVSDLDETRRITSKSLNGHSIIMVELEESTPADAVDNVWDKVRAKVAGVDLPRNEGCGSPHVNAEFSDTSAMVLAVYQKPGRSAGARRRTPRELEIIADRLKDEIKRIGAVGMAELYGVQEEVIYLEIQAGRWGKLKLTADELKQLLEARNIVAPGGSIDTEFARFGLKPTGEFRADREIDSLVVGAHGNRAPVYLRDLGIRVSRTYADPPELIARYRDPNLPEGVDCIILSFTMKAGRNITELGGTVRALLRDAKASWLPGDIEVAVVSDQPASVGEKIHDFTGNLWRAIAIVVAVTFLLVGLRVAVVMAAAIPLVMLTSLGIVPMFGVQLEQISISALIIALGMLVDNAIEVCDNTHRYLEEGLAPYRAAARGAGEIAVPVLFATLTTVAAFLPMLTLTGSEGEYVYSLPVVVSVTLIVSWLVALTMTTIMSYWFVRKSPARAPLAALVGWIARLVRRILPGPAPAEAPSGGIYATYAKLAAGAMRHKLLTIGLAVTGFAASIALVATGQIGTQYFPSAHRSQFVISVDLPEGTPIARTREVCRQLEDILVSRGRLEVDGEPVNALVNFAAYIGGGGPRFYLSLNPKDPGPNIAFVLVNTVNPDVVEPYVRAVREAARRQIPGARISPKRLDMGPPVDFPLQLRVMGTDIARLRGIAEELKGILRSAPGTWDVHDSWGRQGYQMFIRTDEERAKLAGVTNAAVAQTSNALFSGHYLTSYREGDHRLPVFLRLPAAKRGSLEDVYAIRVEGKSGKVPIDAVADIDTDWVPAKIERRKQLRTIQVNARVGEHLLANSVLAGIMPQVTRLAESLEAPYRVEVGGEQEETDESQENMGRALTISLLLIVILLVMMYNSLVKPLLILMTLPMAATGALFGLFVTGKPLGFMANLGMLSLAGVVVNDAIVLIEFVEALIKKKLSAGEGLATAGQRSCTGLTREAFRECVVRGARMRLLPIVLTTLTTVGGLMPLALSGGPLFEPMATVVIFGLLLATLLTLLVLPAVLCVFVEVFRLRLVKVEALPTT